MKTLRTFVAVGLVAALATPTLAQNAPGASPPGSPVQNAVAVDSGEASNAIQPVGFVLLGDHHGHGCSDGSCGPVCQPCAPPCHPGYSGCQTCYTGCQTFGECPQFGGCYEGDCFVESCCGNKWEFRGGWINMKRVSEDVVLVQDLQQGTGAIIDVLNGDDFDYDFASGLDGSVLYSFDGCTGLEFRYLWINEVDDSQERSDLGNTQTTLVTQFPGSVFPNAAAPTTFGLVATNESEFQTAEINVRSMAGSRVTLIGGFRYAQLDESLAIRAGLPTGVTFTSWDTENDLYGMQAGVEVALVRVAGDCFRIDGLAKGGVYYNDVRTSVFDSGIASGLAPRSAGSGDDAVAFLGEFGLYAHWQVMRHVALRAGYQCIWFNGVSTAEGQVASTGSISVPPLATMADTTGNAVFHGVNLMVIGSF